MKTYYLDTNVILRYLLADVVSQFKLIKKYLSAAKKGRIKLRLISEVIMEAVFVLGKLYGVPREKITQLLKGFIKSLYIETENKDQMIKALNLFGKTRLDFVDLLLYVRAEANEAEILSFDKDFLKIKRKLENRGKLSEEDEIIYG